MSQAWTHPARGTVQAQTKGTLAVSTDSSTTPTPTTDAVTWNPDGSVTLSTPYRDKALTFGPLPKVTHEQSMAVMQLAHQRVMQHLAQEELRHWVSSAGAATRKGDAKAAELAQGFVDQLAGQVVAHQEAASALEALLWGER